MQKERFKKHVEICERAKKEGISDGDRMGELMDVERIGKAEKKEKRQRVVETGKDCPSAWNDRHALTRQVEERRTKHVRRKESNY